MERMSSLIGSHHFISHFYPSGGYEMDPAVSRDCIMSHPGLTTSLEPSVDVEAMTSK